MASRTVTTENRTNGRRVQQDKPASGPRRVNGLLVVKDEEVLSNLPARPEKGPITLKQYRRLTLEDGSQVVGCVDCDTTGDWSQIRRHRKTTHPKEQATSPAAPVEPAPEPAVVEPPAEPTPPVATRRRRTGTRVDFTSPGEDEEVQETPTVTKVDPNADIRSITLGEILDLAKDAHKWADIFDNLRIDIKVWKDRALDAEALNNRIRAALGEKAVS